MISGIPGLNMKLATAEVVGHWVCVLRVRVCVTAVRIHERFVYYSKGTCEGLCNCSKGTCEGLCTTVSVRVRVCVTAVRIRVRVCVLQ